MRGHNSVAQCSELEDRDSDGKGLELCPHHQSMFPGLQEQSSVTQANAESLNLDCNFTLCLHKCHLQRGLTNCHEMEHQVLAVWELN